MCLGGLKWQEHQQSYQSKWLHEDNISNSWVQKMRQGFQSWAKTFFELVNPLVHRKKR